MSLREFSPTELKYHVENLLSRYVHCLDDDQLEIWPTLFTEKCLYRLIARENTDRNLSLAALFCDSRPMLTDRVVSLRHANIYERHSYRHIISSLIITDVKSDEVSASSHYAVFRTGTNGATELYQTGRYDDLIATENGEWLFRQKIVTFDTGRIDSLLATPI